MVVWKTLSAFARNREGNIIVIFALTVSVLLTAAGGAVDLAKAYATRTHLQTAVDTAALAGANDPYQNDSEARKTAERYFQASRTGLIKNVDANYRVSRSIIGMAVHVTVSGVADVDTVLLRMIGIKTLNVGVAATATRAQNVVDIYAVLDMSASMGIAADEANRARLVELTRPYTYNGRGCAFACHTYDSYSPVPTANTYDFARMYGIRLREDVMRDAFAAFVDEMLNPNDVAVKNNQRRIATYGFSDTLHNLSPLSSLPDNAKASLISFPNDKRMNTRFLDVLPAVATEVGLSGAGIIGSPKKMVLLVTDGVQWLAWPATGGGAFEARHCDALKANEVDIAVMEVKYFEDLADNEFFIPLIQPFYPQITPGLSACASPGLYFKVADSAEASLRAAFAEIARAMKPRLSLVR